MAAGFAEAYASNLDFANLKFLSDKMIQRHATSDEIAPHVTGCEFDFVFAKNRFDGFSFDEGKFVLGFGLRKCSELDGVAVAFESGARDGFDLSNCESGCGGFFRNVNGFESAVPHGGVSGHFLTRWCVELGSSGQVRTPALRELFHFVVELGSTGQPRAAVPT